MKRSTGSVIKTKGGWFARLRYTDAAGQPREKKRKFPTRKQADLAIADLKADAESEKADRKTYRELDSFYRKTYLHKAKFAGDHKISGFRQNLANIELQLDRALEVFGDREIDTITYADLAQYRQRIAARPARGRQRSLSGINHHMRQLRRLFNIAIEQQWLAVSPFKFGGPLIVESIETSRTRVLSRNEEARLLAACDKRRKHLRPVIVFAIETGLRRGEPQSLRWSSVDLGKRYFRIESLNSKTLKSRLVPLSGRAAETLAQLWQNSTRRQSAFVFGPSDFKTAFVGASADAKLADVHFHDLRHTAITRMLEKGISPPLVMKISGHSTMKTFMRYVNQTEGSIFEIAQKLDRAA